MSEEKMPHYRHEEPVPDLPVGTTFLTIAALVLQQELQPPPPEPVLKVPPALCHIRVVLEVPPGQRRMWQYSLRERNRVS